jgi:hypothetical protein
VMPAPMPAPPPVTTISLSLRARSMRGSLFHVYEDKWSSLLSHVSNARHPPQRRRPVAGDPRTWSTQDCADWRSAKSRSFDPLTPTALSCGRGPRRAGSQDDKTRVRFARDLRALEMTGVLEC